MGFEFTANYRFALFHWLAAGPEYKYINTTKWLLYDLNEVDSSSSDSDTSGASDRIYRVAQDYFGVTVRVHPPTARSAFMLMGSYLQGIGIDDVQFSLTMGWTLGK